LILNIIFERFGFTDSKTSSPGDVGRIQSGLKGRKSGRARIGILPPICGVDTTLGRTLTRRSGRRWSKRDITHGEAEKKYKKREETIHRAFFKIKGSDLIITCFLFYIRFYSIISSCIIFFDFKKTSFWF
jgi:hypothetical protein